MTLLADFTVPGQPVPQGSLSPFVHAKTGRVVTPQKRSLVEWRETIAWHARQSGIPAEPTLNPVRVHLDFWLQRPKRHFGTGRNKSDLKATAPVWCVSRPDLDKVVRACLDALTAVIWRDDSQVVAVAASKGWTGAMPRVEIEVHEIGEWTEYVG